MTKREVERFFDTRSRFYGERVDDGGWCKLPKTQFTSS